MSKSTENRTTVYPGPRAIAVLGGGSSALTQAAECWAEIIKRAAADNAAHLDRQDWCLLADVNNGTMWMPGDWCPGSGLQAQVEDGDRLDGLGEKWFGKPARDARIKRLVAYCASADYAHAWAIIIVCQRFWDRHEKINMRRDEWWKL